MPEGIIDILLVEDSEDDVVFFLHALEEAKLSDRLRVTRDAVEAMAVLFGPGDPAETPPVVHPKVIVVDLKLPKMSGQELLQILKANKFTRAIPIVVLSSSQEKRDLAECYRLGVNSYLVKPMDFDEFAATIRIMVRYWLEFNRNCRL